MPIVRPDWTLQRTENLIALDNSTRTSLLLLVIVALLASHGVAFRMKIHQIISSDQICAVNPPECGLALLACARLGILPFAKPCPE